MRSMFAASAFLSLLALAPPPQQPPTPEHARVYLSATSSKGLLNVIVWDDACLVRADGPGPWLGPIQVSSLAALTPPEDGGATAGVTFCIKASVKGPMMMGTLTVTKKIEILETGRSLDVAVAKAAEKLAGSIPPGWSVVKCDD